jgi:lactate permease
MMLQNYNPFHNELISIIVAASPIAFMFFLLVVARVKGYIAGVLTLGYTLVAALFWGLPLTQSGLAGFFGFSYGIFPIIYIIFPAFFLYNLVVASGHFQAMRHSLESLTPDRRLQVLLIGFCFTSFLDATAGFVAPVAISTAILVSIGFPAMTAAAVCLVASAVPAAFGAIGIPVIVMSKVTGFPVDVLSKTLGTVIPFMSVLIPAWLVIIVSGPGGARGIWPHITVTSLLYAGLTWLVATYHGPYLAGVIPAVLSLFGLLATIKLFPPQELFRFTGDAAVVSQAFRWRQFAWGWLPFVILTACVIVWNLPFIAAFLEQFTFVWYLRGLHNVVVMIPPASLAPSPLPAALTFNLASNTGTSLLLATVISAFVLKIKPKTYVSVFSDTLRQLKWPTVNMGSVFALAFIINFSGMSATLGLAFSHAGALYPFFTPFLALLGSFIVGSNTATNAMFGSLAMVSAQNLGFDPVVAVSVLSAGTVVGKMIAPQALAVAASSAGLTGKEGEIFTFTLKHSFIFAVILGVIAMVRAFIQL